MTVRQSKLGGFGSSSKAEPELSECEVRKLPQKVGRGFIIENHYTSGCGVASMIWGMFWNDGSGEELIGAIAFQTPISENVRASIFGESGKGKVTEFHRMAIKDKAPKNSGSWFISRSLDRLKDYKPKYEAVVSFADTTEGHDGTVYQAANADYYGSTGKATYYRKPDGQLKAPRQVGENITVSEARERGWSVDRRDVKHRYVFWLPGPYQSKRELREKAKIEIKPYP